MQVIYKPLKNSLFQDFVRLLVFIKLQWCSLDDSRWCHI